MNATIQSIGAIVAVGVSVTLPLSNFMFTTSNTANRALSKTEEVESRLERIENKLDKLSEKLYVK